MKEEEEEAREKVYIGNTKVITTVQQRRHSHMGGGRRADSVAVAFRCDVSYGGFWATFGELCSAHPPCFVFKPLPRDQQSLFSIDGGWKEAQGVTIEEGREGMEDFLSRIVPCAPEALVYLSYG